MVSNIFRFRLYSGVNFHHGNKNSLYASRFSVGLSSFRRLPQVFRSSVVWAVVACSFASVDLAIAQNKEQEEQLNVECLKELERDPGGVRVKFISNCILKLAKHLSSSIHSAEQNAIRTAKEYTDQIEEKIDPKSIDRRLIEKFSNASVISQVQAQAACFALAPNSTWVQAVYRDVTHTANGVSYSDKCGEICPRQIANAGNGNAAQSIGAIHIYADAPPFDYSANDSKFKKGLRMHKYPKSESNESFGPNYCCCAG